MEQVIFITAPFRLVSVINLIMPSAINDGLDVNTRRERALDEITHTHAHTQKETTVIRDVFPVQTPILNIQQ